jgi:hypothetical protein
MPREMTTGPTSRALQRAGFVKLPARWVTQDQLELIEYMARQNLPEIARIKKEIHDAQTTDHPRHDD